MDLQNIRVLYQFDLFSPPLLWALCYWALVRPVALLGYEENKGCLFQYIVGKGQ